MANIPTTPQEWIDFARTFADTVDREMDEFDTMPLEDVVDKLPVILSLLNSVCALRWQENLFLGSRPHGTSQFQWELYWLEQRATERFENIMNRIKEAWLAEEARKSLSDYLVDFWFPVK